MRTFILTVIVLCSFALSGKAQSPDIDINLRGIYLVPSLQALTTATGDAKKLEATTLEGGKLIAQLIPSTLNAKTLESISGQIRPDVKTTLTMGALVINKENIRPGTYLTVVFHIRVGVDVHQGHLTLFYNPDGVSSAHMVMPEQIRIRLDRAATLLLNFEESKSVLNDSGIFALEGTLSQEEPRPTIRRKGRG
jgi:hypothetical protein